MSKAKEVAAKITETCERYGWTFSVRGSIFEIQKQIPVNDNDAFVRADMEYYSILELLPSTSAGSVWGTDGGGIGALSAMKNGRFVMKKSGGSKRVLNALRNNA